MLQKHTYFPIQTQNCHRFVGAASRGNYLVERAASLNISYKTAQPTHKS